MYGNRWERKYRISVHVHFFKGEMTLNQERMSNHCKCTHLGFYGGMLIIITFRKRKNNGMTLVRFCVIIYTELEKI